MGRVSHPFLITVRRHPIEDDILFLLESELDEEECFGGSRHSFVFCELREDGIELCVR